MLEFLKKMRNGLQGYKTAIGGILLLLIQESWFLDMLPDGTTESAVVWTIGMIAKLFLGVGLIDKGYKWYTDRTYNDLKKEVDRVSLM